MTLSEMLNKIDEGVWYSRDELIDALRDVSRLLGDLSSARGQPAFVQLGMDDYHKYAYMTKAKHPLYD